MRATTTVLGFGLLCMSLPVAAQAAPTDKAPSAKSESTKSEARVGSLAPDEARRAERARRRAAEKNAKAASRETDHKMLEGKSVAAPDTPTEKNSAAAAVIPAPATKAVERRDVKPAQKTATQAPEVPAQAIAPVKTAVAPAAAPQRRETTKDSLAKNDGRARDKGDVEYSRSADRNVRGHDRHDKRYASRRNAHRERFANDGAYRRSSPDAVIVEDEAPAALPPGAPPYPLRPRGPREVYVVRELPAPPPAYEDYGPRPFYGRGPGFMRGPVDDVE